MSNQLSRASLMTIKVFPFPRAMAPEYIPDVIGIIDKRIQPRIQLRLRRLPRAAPIPHTTLALSSRVLNDIRTSIGQIFQPLMLANAQFRMKRQSPHRQQGSSADRHTNFLEVRSCPESGLDQHRLPLRTLLRTPFALPSHTPNTSGWYESGRCEDTGPGSSGL